MNHKRTILILTVLIGLLSAFASGVGAFSRGGVTPSDFASLHGQVVPLHGSGLYRFESVSLAAQAIAQDYVTLLLGIPLLAVSLGIYLKGSLRGKLLLAGTLGYFLYTYITMIFNANYNPLFLIYVGIASMSLFAVILTIQQIDVASLPGCFSPRLPRRGTAALLFFMAFFVLALHLSRIVPALLNASAPDGLEHYTTMVISATDLGLIAPVTIISGILLLQKRPWGYLLAALMLVKCVTLATAVTAMGINQVLAGGELVPVVFAMPVLTAFTVYFFARLMANLRSEPALVEIHG